MSKSVTYLTFNGNCNEAMNFYRDCLGGELRVQRIGDTPNARNLPPAIKHFIVHATLQKDNILIMGSDMIEDDGLKRGNTMSILLECDNQQEMHHYYGRLADRGKATHPITSTFWGAFFGGLTDRFGHRWLFHCKPTIEKALQ